MLGSYILVVLLLLSCQKETPMSNPEVVIDPQRDAQPSRVESSRDTSFTSLVETYENPNRVNWQNPALVISKMNDISDKTVVDLGAGTGYFTFRLIPKSKKVIAIDIDERMLSFIKEANNQIPSEYQDRVETRLATFTDSKLKDGEGDVIFMANTYSLISGKKRYLQDLKSKLSKNGRLFIVDYKKKLIPVGPEQESRVALHQLERTLLDVGYTIIESDDHSLPFQYIVIAEK